MYKIEMRSLFESLLPPRGRDGADAEEQGDERALGAAKGQVGKVKGDDRLRGHERRWRRWRPTGFRGAELDSSCSFCFESLR